MIILEYIKLFFIEAATLFVDMAPYLTLGILIAGLMHVLLSKDFVARQIGGNNISSVFKAALFGVPLPLCSCGVVPTAVYLKNSGASKSSVTSFLISTPQTGIDSISATWGMLGPLFAIFRALAALIMGIAGGVADFLLDRRGKEPSQQEKSKNNIESEKVNLYPGFFGKIKEMFNYAIFELLDDITINFLVGLGIAAVIAIAIPDDFFASSLVANPIIGMILMIIIGIPMYICSTSSIPIAVAFIAKGISPGAAYVFLVAGPATNAASLAIIGKSLGKKTTVRYLVTIIIGALLFGFGLDKIYNALGLSPFGMSMTHHHAEGIASPFMIAVSIFLLAMIILLLGRRLRAKIKGQTISCSCGDHCGCGEHEHCGCEDEHQGETSMTRINIDGMQCKHCSASVEKALTNIKGIDKIEISLEGKYAEVDGDFDLNEAVSAIENAGYTVTSK
ncbi:MAG: permease [Spirochaetales bacterium]|nr:permease [Spirochaetales bacterium]